MSMWVAVRQALAAMETVERAWGRELELNGCELMAMLLVARRPGCCTSHIAWFAGLRRQNAWRTMKGLERRGVVHAARRSVRGAEGWSLTHDGLLLARSLEARLHAWEEMISTRVDLPELVASLERAVESLVNRPSAEGWAAGLHVPHEVRWEPHWDQHLDRAVLPEACPVDDLPNERPGGKTEEEIAQLDAAWNALWR